MDTTLATEETLSQSYQPYDDDQTRQTKAEAAASFEKVKYV